MFTQVSKDGQSHMNELLHSYEVKQYCRIYHTGLNVPLLGYDKIFFDGDTDADSEIDTEIIMKSSSMLLLGVHEIVRNLKKLKLQEQKFLIGVWIVGTVLSAKEATDLNL